MIDGRGKHSTIKRKKLTALIKGYIKNNPDKMKKEVMEEFGISYQTLRAHIKIINS